jgi:D-hexose-6-phosphate mutarotase
MHNDQIQALNAQFGLDTQLRFEIGAGELVFAQIRNDHATAEIALQGAHVLSYQPHGQQPILWVSQQSNYSSGKAIRGGIPVCWPWFGPHPSNPALPAHGFARTSEWQVVGAEARTDGATELRLELSDNERTRAIWPHVFRLTMVVTVGRELHVDLISHNSGMRPSRTVARCTAISISATLRISRSMAWMELHISTSCKETSGRYSGA